MTDPDPNASAIRAFLRRIGVYAGLLIAGAVFAFAYSYVPLHRAKNWQIDHLESRLEATNQELIRLRELVDTLETDNADRPDADTYKTIQQELDRSDQHVAELEGNLERAKKQIAELERSRDSWRRKHGELANRLDATPRSGVAANGPAAEAPAPGPSAAATPSGTAAPEGASVAGSGNAPTPAAVSAADDTPTPARLP